jgi:NADH:ubiquinone oxidoreductase subunit
MSQRSGFMTFMMQFLTWWSGQTLGTRFHTWRHGEFVGEDSFGNKYYRTAGGKIDPALGIERRWVIFNGPTEASAVPPEWIGWLRNVTPFPPTQEAYKSKPWEKAWVPNQTGLPGAYRPQGSTLAAGQRPAATGDYEAWTP